MESVLVGFLKAGLLPIGEDDEKLNLLKSAAAELAKEVKATPLLAYRFALAGFDDQIKATDPTIKRAEAAVFRNWQTISNKVGPDPVQLYRGILLRAVQLAAQDDSKLSHALVLIAENEEKLPQGKAKEPVICMLTDLTGKITEDLTHA